MLLSDLSQLGILVGLIITVLGAVFGLGNYTAKRKSEKKDLKDFKEGVAKIDKVVVNTDRDAALERLRSKGHLRPDDPLQ